MFERYTESARRAVFFARYEASQLGGASIEAEHLLLGVLREGDPFIAGLFSKTRLSMLQVRREVESRSPSRGKGSTSVEMPLSRESRRALDHAAEEAERLRHGSIGTGHLLLGLMREEGSVAAGILTEMGLRVTAIREELLLHLDEAAALGRSTDTPTSDAPIARECNAPHGEDPEDGLFARFTERARRVIFFARYETARLGGAAIETEHLLLGLLREGKGLTAHILSGRHISHRTTFPEVEARSPSGRPIRPTSIDVPLSPETKRVLSYAAYESAGMGHCYIGNEHLLLGLLREDGSLAATILEEKGMRLAATREEILTLLVDAAVRPAGSPPPFTAHALEEGKSEPPPLVLSDLDRRFLQALKITPD
jgi:ATP-dependent Clp protease ATP-binding subunit ClpA